MGIERLEIGMELGPCKVHEIHQDPGLSRRAAATHSGSGD